jgi:hypothetical protein
MPDSLYGGVSGLTPPPSTFHVFWTYGGFSFGGEAAGTAGVLYRSAADTVGTVADSATHAPINAARRATEGALVVSDSARISVTTRTTDTVAFSDVASPSAVRGGRLTNDSWTVGDAATRTTPTRTRTALDSWTVNDIALRGGGISRLVTDSLTVSDSAASHPGVSRSALDAVGFWGDVASIRAVTLARQANELIVVRDSARGPSVPLSAFDIVLVNDIAGIPGRAAIAGMPFMLVRRTMI